MSNLSQNQLDDEDPDIMELRLAALSSLASKPKKRAPDDANSSHMSPIFQPDRQNPMIFSPAMHDQSLNMPMNGLTPLNYAGQRPAFINQPLYNPGLDPGYHHQPMMPRPSFVQHPQAFPSRHPMMPVIQPHLNPNFITQKPHTARFIPAGSEILPVPSGLVEREDGMPLLPEKTGTFEPTPPSRLSPRSAQFVAQNNEALRRQRRRSFSPGRSRSRSPYSHRYSRSRSRSPHYKAQISHIARKRTRSKSPNSFVRKSRSPRRRVSPIKRLSPKYVENDRNKRRPYKRNGNASNRERQGRQENDLNYRQTRISPKNSDEVKNENGLSNDKIEPQETSQSIKESKKSEVKEKREKTEQELEDELLASTDSEAESVKAADDEDVFKMTLDEKDLDFLDDDEEESENEGRFKSKTTSSTEQKKPAVTTNNFKSSYSARNYEKPRNYGDKNNQRSDYRRYKYNDKDDSRRDRKRSRSPLDSSERRTRDEKQYGSPSRKKRSPEPRKSPEPAQKPVKETTKLSKVIITTTTKDKQEAVKDELKKVKVELPKFKATFQTIEASVDENKKDEEVKKDDRVPDRVRLVRAPIVSKITEPIKVEKHLKSKEVEGKRPAIMKRLGGFIKDPGQKAAKAWAREQIVQILCENLVKELKNLSDIRWGFRRYDCTS